MADGASARLVTSVEIARLAGVGRAAVSNWRRRYPDFPKPAGGPDNSPTFSLEEVERWLAATGKGEQLRTDGVTKTGTWRLDRTTQPTVPRTQSAVGDGAVRGPSLRADTRATSSFFGKTFEQTAERRGEHRRARYAATLAALQPDEIQGLVIDPACGDGGLLEAAALRFGAAIGLVGLDARPDAVRAAAARAANVPSREIAVGDEFSAGDSLTGDRLPRYRGSAAGVLCEPPTDQPQWPADELADDPRWVFGLPAPRDSELAWVQLCYDLLRPNATAVIALSPRTCVQQSGRSIRAAMLRAGALRAVVALPRGADPDGSDTVVWVLRRPAGEPAHPVAMVDLTGIEPPDLPVDHAAWQAVFADPAWSAQVAAIDLLDDEVALLPARFVARDTRELAAGYIAATHRLPALLRNLADGFPRLERNRTEPEFPLVALHELERIGSLHVRPRTYTPRAGDVLVYAGDRAPTVAEPENAPDTPTAPERAVSHVIEIDPDRVDPYFVAGFLYPEASLVPTANTAGTINREDLRRCRIPRLPLTTQRQYGAAFRRLAELEAVLSKMTELSGDVLRLAAEGLVTGALAPPSSVAHPQDERSGE